MIYNKKVLAIIPARAGSKGLKNKNIKIFNKKPLICWTLDQAKKCKYIDRIYISTDSKKILDKIKQYKIEIPFLRPRYLAQDRSKSEDVVLFELKRIEKYFKEKFDIVVLLEPTNPLRYDEDIGKAIKQLAKSTNYSSIVGVSPVKFSPEIIYSINSKNKRLEKVFKQFKSISRRQDANEFFFPNGTIYAVKKKYLLLERKIYTKKIMGFVNKKSQAKGEIDDIFDFYSTEILFKKFFN